MDVLWGPAGTALFDHYSLHHTVWFIAITIIGYLIFKKYIWIAAIIITTVWELFETWAAENLPRFPFTGKEEFLNKVVGDTISNIVGFLIAILIIRLMRKKKNER